MQDLTITLVQTHLVWENIDANLDLFDARIESIKDATDLIILPEMFSTGFSMNADSLAEEMTGKAVTWLRQKAVEKKTTITGSVMVKDGGRFFNRLVWARTDGELITYDKKHLFRYAGEEKVFTAGQSQVTLELNGWRIRPFICYDLRFPALYRSLAQAGASFITVPAAFTRFTGQAHWHVLLRARAIETGCYVIAPAQCGTHAGGRQTYGHSLIAAPWGEVLADSGEAPGLALAEIDPAKVAEARRMVPSLSGDRDFAAPRPAQDSLRAVS